MRAATRSSAIAWQPVRCGGRGGVRVSGGRRFGRLGTGFAAIVLMSANVSAQVLTVPDDRTLPFAMPGPPAPPADSACGTGQICIVSVAGCPVPAPAVVHQRKRPPPVSEAAGTAIGSQLTGLNRHPDSVIVCGPTGTCRGFGRSRYYHHDHGHIAYSRHFW